MKDLLPKEKGEQAEAWIIAELISRKVPVSIPFGDNQRYDLILDHHDKLYTAQCKWGRSNNGSVLFNTVSTRINSKTYITKNYDGVDIFLVWHNDSKSLFCVDIPLASKGSMRLRLDKAKNNSGGHLINWAYEHEIDKWLDKH